MVFSKAMKWKIPFFILRYEWTTAQCSPHVIGVC